ETITRSWTFTDACGNNSTETQIITVWDTQAPVFTAPPIAANYQCPTDVPAAGNLNYTDNCDPNGTVPGTDVSNGLTCPETITRSWTFTDACGNNSTETQIITVWDTQAPVFTAPPIAANYQCPADVPAVANLNYTDNCDPNGSIIGIDASNGLTCPETITRTWTFTDLCGNVASVSQIITIDDTTLPTASNPAGQAGVPPAPDVNVVIDEADNCGLPGVTWVSDVSDNGNCPEIITRTYRVTDACGNFIDVTQTFTIGDAILPTASNPANINIECVISVPASNPLVVSDENDNGALPTVTWEDDISDNGSCPETISRRYRVTDECGNFIFVTQLIIIMDVTAPIMNPAPLAAAVQCIGDVPAMITLAYTDNCDVPGTVNGTDVSDNGSCPETITRTWTFTDICGNGSIPVTQVITVWDTQAPLFTAPPIAVNYQCSLDVPAAGILNYTDNCDPNGNVVGTDVSNGLTCPETITRTWTFSDICGNNSTVTQIITVWDTQAPILAAAPGPLTVQCPGDVPALISLSYTDNCDPSSTVLGVDDPLLGGNCGGTITRTWTVTDLCGNTSTATQIITIDDTTLPTASNPLTTALPGGPAPAPDVTVVIDELDNCTIAPAVALVSNTTDGAFCPETITHVYSVTDACGNSINVTHIILITDPILPTADPLAPVSYNCIADVPVADVTVILNEADNNGVPVVSWSGDISDNGNCPEIITRTYRVTDICGNFIDIIQVITINVTAGPIVPANAGSTVECIASAIQPASPVVTDQCGNNLTPVITENVDPACEGSKVYTYTYTDCAGNISVYSYTYTIDLNTLPVVPANYSTTVECLASVMVPTAPAVTDICGNNIIAVLTQNADPACEGSKVFTFTYTDCAGNVSIYTYTYVIDITTLPVVPANTTDLIQCAADIFIPTAPIVTDVCGNNIVPVMTENAYPICAGDKIYTFTYTDCAGNVSVFTYTFTVNDNTNPTASNPLALSVPGALDVPLPDDLVVTDEADNCTAYPTVLWISDVSDGNICNGEIITRTYSVTDDCGNSILVTQLITIEATYPPLDAGTDQLICIGEQVILAASNPSGAILTWDNGVIDNQAFAPLTTIIYTATADNLGCITTDQVTVIVEELPVVSFIGDILSGCAPLSVTFNNSTPGIMVDCIWNINGEQLSSCGSVTYDFNSAGLFDVTLTTTSANGCSNSATYTDYIYVEADPVASFIPSTNELNNLNSEMWFENTSSGASTYSWEMGDGSTSTMTDPVHLYPSEDAAVFIIEMVAYSPLGCMDTAWTTINLTEEVIYYVPNSFTPDDDDYNPTFQPVFTAGYDPFDFTLLIYNRWGEIIFESHDASVGWDGTYGGVLVQDGTYSWAIEFKTTATDQRVSVNGHLNLIR
ncbi:MAG: gliding motility-associated-like protein, partial [Flavobacteriaceae bacterium]